MKLAFSTNAFTRHTLDEAVRTIAECGYAGVEILADAPHADPAVFTDAQTDVLTAQLQQLHLGVSNVNANCSFGYFSDAPAEPFFEPSLISPDAQWRTDRLKRIDWTLRLARRIAAPNISITTGRLLPTMPPARGAELLRKNLARVLEMAEATGTRVGIECEPGLFIEWAVELRALIDEMGSPLLGANLDVGHSFVLGEDLPEAVDRLAGRIWNIHIEDIARFGPAGVPKHYHLIPGEGDMDFPRLRQALDAIGYDNFLTVELYTCPDAPRRAAEASIAHLRTIFGD